MPPHLSASCRARSVPTARGGAAQWRRDLRCSSMKRAEKSALSARRSRSSLFMRCRVSSEGACIEQCPCHCRSCRTGRRGAHCTGAGARSHGARHARREGSHPHPVRCPSVRACRKAAWRGDSSHAGTQLAYSVPERCEAICIIFRIARVPVVRRSRRAMAGPRAIRSCLLLASRKRRGSTEG
jgi:hypothetical protein